MLSTGTIVMGRYRIEGDLGTGGFGTTYKAADAAEGGALVALKVSHATLSSLAPEDKDALERCRREAAMLKKISSPFVLRYVADGEHEDSLVLVMDLAATALVALYGRAPEGRDTPFSEEHVRVVAVECLKGLQAAYKASCLIHRDLAEDNLFIGFDGAVKVGDLGVARIAGLPKMTLGKLPGKPRYQAPECFSRPKEADWRVDAYALAVIVVRLLTKSYPLDVPDDDYETAVEMVLRDAARGPNDIRPKCCSDELHKLALRLLAKDPAKRCGTCEELIKEFGGDDYTKRLCPECLAVSEWDAARCPAGHEFAVPRVAMPRAGEAEGVEAPVPLVVGPPRRRARLLVLRADGKERAVELRPDMPLGRKDLDPKNRFVSRRHALVARREDTWHIEDVGSLNGTYVVAERLPVGAARRLTDGDSLRFGDITARLELY